MRRKREAARVRIRAPTLADADDVGRHPFCRDSRKAWLSIEEMQETATC